MALNDQSQIGLANRFHVKVDQGSYDLGSWQKCEGLDVTWEMPEFRAGDQGNMRWFFPANTKYKTIKLIRAATKDESSKVREWLNKNAWTQGATRGGITITLYDSFAAEILHWDLKNALPKAWNISNMDAGASQVAIETLEFDHEGFLDDEKMLGAS
jgi:phage tail-like protein